MFYVKGWRSVQVSDLRAPGKSEDFNAICADNPGLFVVTSNILTWTFVFHHPGNYYGTPKPPAEPSPVQPDLVDQVLFDEEFDTEVQRKRTTSVSKMDRKDSAAPDEEEEEEKPPMINGLAGERRGCNHHTDFPDLVFSLSVQCRMQTSRDLVSIPIIVLPQQTCPGLAFPHTRSALNHKCEAKLCQHCCTGESRTFSRCFLHILTCPSIVMAGDRRILVRMNFNKKRWSDVYDRLYRS